MLTRKIRRTSLLRFDPSISLFLAAKRGKIMAGAADRWLDQCRADAILLPSFPGRIFMAGRIDARLKELGITLPEAPMPAANYVPFVRSGSLIFVAGQIPLEGGKPQFIGKLGQNFKIEDGQKAARLCALNVIAQVRAALGGNLDEVRRCVRVGGFVNATPDFTDHPQVINGASDVIVQIFGDAGKHARAAVGTSSLPRGVATEVEAVFEVS
jgi:enamine deaminase RidA (YjgF/YER057c/UK114 family)